MFSQEELREFPEYWMEIVQQEIYEEILAYMEQEGLNRKQLANRLDVSKGYVSQILNGRSNFSMKKFIELALKINRYPNITFTPKSTLMQEERLLDPLGKIVSLKLADENNYDSSFSISGGEIELMVTSRENPYIEKNEKSYQMKSLA